MLNNTKRKGAKMKKILDKAFIIVLICVLVVSGYKIANYFYDAQVQNGRFKKMATVVENEKSTEQVKVGKKNIFKKYGELYKKNNDFAGWIKIKNTSINYPVMMTKKDFQYYLKRNFEREYSIYGTPFIGENCEINPESDNIVIYSHNMKNGSMFAALNKYKTYDFYKKNKIVYFDTLNTTGEYEIVYTFTANVGGKGDFEYYKYVNLNNKEEFNEYIRQLENVKLYDTGGKINYKDKVITLSTCENSRENSRMVVVAKKIK